MVCSDIVWWLVMMVSSMIVIMMKDCLVVILLFEIYRYSRVVSNVMFVVYLCSFVFSGML